MLLLAWQPRAQGQPAAPAPAPALSPSQAQSVLDVLKDDKKRADFTAVLENMVHALPAAAGQPAPNPSALVPLGADSLGAQLLVQASTEVTSLTDQFAATAEAVGDVPLLWRWVARTARDPAARGRVLDAAWKLALVLVCAWAVEWVATRIIIKPRQALGRYAPGDDASAPADDAAEDETEQRTHHRRLNRIWRMVRRLPFVLAALTLDVVPIAVFAAVGNAMLATSLGATTNAKLVVLAVVNAYVIVRLVMCVTRILVSPQNRRLRLIQCQDSIAAYTERWLRRIAVVAVFGFALAEVGLLFGLYRSAHDVLLKLVGLTVHVMLIVVVLQCRQAVAQRIRARRRTTGLVAGIQNQLAAQWHLVAIFYLIALWLVAAAEIQNGYVRLLHFFFVTCAVLAVARLATIVVLGGLDRLMRIGPETSARYPGLQARFNTYYPAIRMALSALLTVLAMLALLTAWGFHPFGWFSTGQLGGQVLSAIATSGLTVVIAVMVWEAANAWVERQLAGLTRQAQMARAARLRTLLPMLKTALLVSILIIVGLIVLSQIGVNIAPLLAGAGVLGVAIGFGSQKLVQDLITGLFLLLENTMQVGDVVSLGGLTGTVENLSIRTIRLRAIDGAVHIIPFSSVTTVTNQTRDFSYALIDLAVGLDEAPDRIADLLREVAKGMRAEPRWKDAITADLEVLGVQAFGAHEWTLRARLRTTPSQRWTVSRELNRRIKYRFDELAIQSPITSYRVQGWLPPGAENMLPPPLPEPPASKPPAVPHPESAAS